VYGVRLKSGFIHGCKFKYIKMVVVRHAVPGSKD
jgi:hypothetical protein